MTPVIIQQKEYARTIPVPCGRCPACYKRRVSSWSFRLMQQEKIAETAYFITLTYDTKHVPITDKGFMGLAKRDLQLFFKRLRKSQDAKKAHRNWQGPHSPIRYYACGEYGGKTRRPHYHIIIFNAKLELIQPAWDKGQVHYGVVTGASVGYCLKYMSKVSKIGKAEWDDRIPEFALMSKGLGANYLTPQIVNWHRKDLMNRMYCNLQDGRKVSMPRYYKQKLYKWYELNMINEHVTLQRIEKQEKNPVNVRDHSEAIKSSFKRMEINHYKNQKL